MKSPLDTVLIGAFICTQEQLDLETFIKALNRADMVDVCINLIMI